MLIKLLTKKICFTLNIREYHSLYDFHFSLRTLLFYLKQLMFYLFVLSVLMNYVNDIILN